MGGHPISAPHHHLQVLVGEDFLVDFQVLNCWIFQENDPVAMVSCRTHWSVPDRPGSSARIGALLNWLRSQCVVFA